MKCEKYDTCSLTDCGQCSNNEIRWTDKVYLDSQGNIRSTDGCPTGSYTQEMINKIKTNIYCAKPIEDKENDK